VPLTAASTAAEQQLVMVEGILNGAVISRRTSSVFIPAAITLPAYDEDGNLTNDGRWIYTWDAENRFVQMDTTPQAVAAGAASQKLEFAYDHRSRRISKMVSEDLSGTWRLTQWRKYLYDGWNMIAELDALSDHAIVRTYAWGIDLGGSVDGQGGAGGVGGLLAVKHHGRTTAKIWSAINDANGNVSGWWDIAIQTLTAQMEYDPFGNLIHDSTPEGLTISDVGFSSKLRDQEAGLGYYGFRYYAPDTGRWLNRDPIGERGGLNLYGMVGNDPVNKWDYLGLCKVLSKGVRLRVAAASLDSHQEGSPYSDLARLAIGRVNNLWGEYGIQFPLHLVAGPRVASNVAGALPANSVVAGHFLFFVDFEISEADGPCEMTLKERGSQTQAGIQSPINDDYDWATLKGDGSVVVAKRKHAIQDCGSTMIFVDAPGSLAVKVPIQGQPAFGFAIKLKQIFEIRNGKTGVLVDTFTHKIRVAVDENGQATFSP
jgi:RHS repeat-associated protein